MWYFRENWSKFLTVEMLNCFWTAVGAWFNFSLSQCQRVAGRMASTLIDKSNPQNSIFVVNCLFLKPIVSQHKIGVFLIFYINRRIFIRSLTDIILVKLTSLLLEEIHIEVGHFSMSSCYFWAGHEQVTHELLPQFF